MQRLVRSGYRRRHRHHSDRRAYRRYANNCEAAVRDLLPMFDDARLPVETAIRRLSGPGRQTAATCCRAVTAGDRTSKRCCAPDSRERRTGQRLFNDATISLPTNQRALRQKVTQTPAHKMWINHLRQWAHCRDNAQRLGTGTADASTPWREILITASYRLGLPQQLQKPCSARR